MCLVVEPSGCLEHRDDIGAARGLSYGIRVRANTNSRNRKITAGNVTLKELVDFSEKLKNVNYTKEIQNLKQITSYSPQFVRDDSERQFSIIFLTPRRLFFERFFSWDKHICRITSYLTRFKKVINKTINVPPF